MQLLRFVCYSFKDAKMKNESSILIAVGALTILIVVGAVFFFSSSPSEKIAQGQPIDKTLLVKKESPTKGKKDAKVMVVEFSDFQCPACAAAHPIVKQMNDTYKDKILFVYRYFPLTIHKNAYMAAQAAAASLEQGKFWQMHDMLFDRQNDWEKADNPLDIFVSYASDLNLDSEKFKEALKANKYSTVISQDIADGNALGVNATPTFFVNNEKISGVPSFETLKQVIDRNLK